MTEQEIKARVETVFHDVLDQPTLSLNRETTAQDVEDWDSLTHISLIAGVEKEFKLKFTLKEIKALKNVGDLFDLVQSKMA